MCHRRQAVILYNGEVRTLIRKCSGLEIANTGDIYKKTHFEDIFQAKYFLLFSVRLSMLSIFVLLYNYHCFELNGRLPFYNTKDASQSLKMVFMSAALLRNTKGKPLFRGLRCQMGVHTGILEKEEINEMRQMYFKGAALVTAESLAFSAQVHSIKICTSDHAKGGQILMSDTVYSAIYNTPEAAQFGTAEEHGERMVDRPGQKLYTVISSNAFIVTFQFTPAPVKERVFEKPDFSSFHTEKASFVGIFFINVHRYLQLRG